MTNLSEKVFTRGRPSLLAVGLCLLCLASCSDGPVDQQVDIAPAPRTLVIGMDGLEWNLMLPLLKAGKLPTFAALMESGTYGQLETIVPTVSPVIWTSVATGKGKTKHGILSFVRGNAMGTADELFNNLDRQTKAIWNIVSDFEKRVAVIGWWMTYPVEAINGVMVSQTNTADSFRTKMKMGWKGLLKKGVDKQVYPQTREDEMMQILGEVEASLDNGIERFFGKPRNKLTRFGKQWWTKSQWAFRADATYRKIALTLLDNDPPYDLFMVYFGGADVTGHNLWRYMEPELFTNKPSPEQIEDLGKVIENYYIYLDTVAADLVKAAGENTRIIILSDHGMYAVNLDQPYNEDTGNPLPSGEHVTGPPGIIIASGPDIRQQTVAKPVAALTRADLPMLGSINDLTPTILALMRLPIGADMDGRVEERLIEPQFFVDHPVKQIPTHDTIAWLMARNKDVGELDAPDQTERLRQLRSLGYLGGEDEPAPDDEEPDDQPLDP